MEYNVLKLDDKTSLTLTAFIGFADKPEFIRFPSVPISEDVPQFKWNFSIQALFTLDSGGGFPDESVEYLQGPQQSLSTTTDSTGDGSIIGPRPPVLASVDLQVDVLRNANGLMFTVNRSGSNIPDWENVFVTITAMRTDKFQGTVVFQDVLGRPEEPPRICTIPVQVWQDPAPADPDQEPTSIPFQDFTASVADSIKKAQTQIQAKLGSESFDLDLEQFEIKTPYVVNIGSNNELLMTKPAASDQAGPYEPAFSRMTFRKSFKLE
jgi:hypothetical protein